MKYVKSFSTKKHIPTCSALNATMAVQRVQSRQSQSMECKEEPSVLVSQVLNPELPINQSGNVEEFSVLQCVLSCLNVII